MFIYSIENTIKHKIKNITNSIEVDFKNILKKKNITAIRIYVTRFFSSLKPIIIPFSAHLMH